MSQGYGDLRVVWDSDRPQSGTGPHIDHTESGTGAGSRRDKEAFSARELLLIDLAGADPFRRSQCLGQRKC